MIWAVRRVICLPTYDERENLEPMVRALGELGLEGLEVLVIDEAARVPDDLYRAVRPMLAVSGGLEQGWLSFTSSDAKVRAPGMRRFGAASLSSSGGATELKRVRSLVA
jgi:hypothetical protein